MDMDCPLKFIVHENFYMLKNLKFLNDKSFLHRIKGPVIEGKSLPPQVSSSKLPTSSLASPLNPWQENDSLIGHWLLDAEAWSCKVALVMMVWQQDKAFWFPMLLCTQVLSACTPVLGEDASMELPQQSCHLRRWKIAACSKLFSTKSMSKFRQWDKEDTYQPF